MEKRPLIGLCRKISNLFKVSSVFNVCFISYTKQVNYKVSSTAKIMHFCYRRTIRPKQENFSRNNKTNYTRRHKFITQKKNFCQVFSRSRNDQPLFVNEDKFKVGRQSSSLKNGCLENRPLRPPKTPTRTTLNFID